MKYHNEHQTCMSIFPNAVDIHHQRPQVEDWW